MIETIRVWRQGLPVDLEAEREPMTFAIVSASDAAFFDLLKALVCSVQDKPQGHGARFCLFDTGLTADQRHWLADRGAVFAVPDRRFGRPVPGYIQALAARPELPRYFPGFDSYLWIDADAWVQEWPAVEAYLAGARQHGFAVTPECDPGYDNPRIAAIYRTCFQGFGDAAVRAMAGKPPVNAGVFCGRADAPHWALWQRRVEDAARRSGGGLSDFYLDQTALNLVLYGDGGLPCALLPASHNWMCHQALPFVSPDGASLLAPAPPHAPLGIIHTASDTKRRFIALNTPDGGRLARPLGYQARSLLPPGDYVAPGLTPIIADPCFPEMREGDRSASAWPWLRHDNPHPWYVDRRLPTWGFVSRDEASLLYNTALRFRGRPALEIGCLFGWSACHLALGGVDLDVIDPLLARPEVEASVSASLRLSACTGTVNLLAAASPAGLAAYARRTGRRWALFFIDGNHEGDAPLRDTIECERHALPDAAMLFHDLTSPAVARGLGYLRAKQWQVRLYDTAQIMAIAWRGAVAPVDHRPDPRVAWTRPEHLDRLAAASPAAV